MKRKEAVPIPEGVYTTRLTLKQWLVALEQAEILKPGATTRILTSRRLTRVALPKIPLE